jgi:hypothetical protein
MYIKVDFNSAGENTLMGKLVQSLVIDTKNDSGMEVLKNQEVHVEIYNFPNKLLCERDFTIMFSILENAYQLKKDFNTKFIMVFTD